MNRSQTQFWSVPSSELLQQLQTSPQGLKSDEIQQRLLRYGSNLLKPKKKSDALTLLIAQFKGPIILILIFAAGLSFFLRNPIDAVIILVIVLVSGFLGFWQERGAVNAVEKLLPLRFGKNDIAKHTTVDFTVRQQYGFAEVLNDFPVGRQTFFDHLTGNAVGINYNGAGFFKYRADG